jgi:sortase A
LRIAGWTLLGAGALVGLFLVYQLFVTDLINARSQAQAAEQLSEVLVERREQVAPASTTSTSTSAPATTTTTLPVAELLTEPEVDVGEPFARILIPKIELDAVLFQGVDRATLKLGPGHMPDTPLPGQPGNAVVSGHRTTYGRPFYDLDLLARGDRIEVETALGVSTYAVRDVLIVSPTDVWVTDPRDGAWLTLTTCNPRFSAAQRLIIQAELVDGPNFEYVQTLEANIRAAA